MEDEIELTFEQILELFSPPQNPEEQLRSIRPLPARATQTDAASTSEEEREANHEGEAPASSDSDVASIPSDTDEALIPSDTDEATIPSDADEALNPCDTDDEEGSNENVEPDALNVPPTKARRKRKRLPFLLPEAKNRAMDEVFAIAAQPDADLPDPRHARVHTLIILDDSVPLSGCGTPPQVPQAHQGVLPNSRKIPVPSSSKKRSKKRTRRQTSTRPKKKKKKSK